MQCPNCGTAGDPGAVFCASCGAALPAEVAPTQPMPQASAPVPPPLPPRQEPVGAQGAPAVEPPPMPVSAAPQYAQPTAQYAQPTAPQYAQPGAPQAMPGQPQPPVKKKKTWLIIVIVAVVLLFLLGGCIAAVLVFMPFKQEIEEIPITPAVVTTETAPVASGFGTAEEALASVLETDWVFKATRTTEDRVTYWTGPPNSEYVDEIVVEKGSDGSWTVTDQYTIGGGDVPGDAGTTAENEAKAVLSEFLDYIKADNPEAAHKLTIEPFSLDAASAGYSNGEFLSYEIKEAELQDDGAFWIHVEEKWKNSTDNWGYYVVPTDAGYRISDLKPW